MGSLNPENDTNVQQRTEGDDAPATAPGPGETAESTPAGRDEAAAAEIEQLRKELDAARSEAAEYKDKYLRALAEAENVRRRAEQEVASAHKFAVERFAAEILAVRDSLELARDVDLGPEVPEAVQKMHEGLDLTLKLLDKVFQQFELTPIDPQGEKFDPNRQHAIGTVESGEVAPNHVVKVVQKGYLLRDRVLRPALVVVSRAREGKEDGEADA
jgi:molecular chaperone GrpE